MKKEKSGRKPRQSTGFVFPVAADYNDYRLVFYGVSFDLMLNIRKFRCGYELLITLCIAGDSDIAGIYLDATPN